MKAINFKYPERKEMQNLKIAVSLQKRNNFMFKWYMIFKLSENKSAVIKIGLIQNSEVSNPEFHNNIENFHPRGTMET